MRIQTIQVLLALALLSPLSYADPQAGYQHFREAHVAYTNQDFTRAEQLLLTALKEIEANDPKRPNALSLLAYLYTQKQQYAQALPLWKELCQLAEQKETADITTLQAYNNLASTYISLNQLPQALSAFEKSVELQKTLMGADHVEVGKTYTNIATLSLQLGDGERARSAFQVALPILKKALPPNDPVLQQAEHNYQVSKQNNMAVVQVSPQVMALINQGDQAFQSGNQAQALEAYQAALDETLKTYGNRHPSLAILQEKIEQARRFNTDSNYFDQLDPKVTRWNDKTQKIVVYIQPGQGHRYWKPEYDEMIKKAFSAWETALNHKHKIVYTDTPRDVDVFVNWYDKPISKHQAGTKQLGVNQFASTDEYMTQNDIDIVLDNPIDDPDFLYSTLLHEIGHLMGLRGHSDNPNDILFNYAQVGWKPVTELSKRDIETIQRLYQTPAAITNHPNKHISDMQ